MNNNDNKLTSPFWRLIADDISIQIIVTIIAIVVYTVLYSVFNEKTALIATSVVFIPVYCFMLYTMFWGVAERERNMVIYGHMKEDLKRGVKAGIISAVPLFIFTVITIAVVTGKGSDSNIASIYKIVTAPFVGITALLIKKSVWFTLLIVFVQPICAILGYHNGHKLYRILDHILYEDGIKANRKNRNQPKRRR